LAEFLTGKEAQAAAEEDGATQKGEPVPNDYYIRNPEQTVVTLSLAPTVEVTLVRCTNTCEEGVPADLPQLAAEVEELPHQSRYWVTVADGLVTAVDGQYVP
jgi:hypothetical protein